MEFLSLIPLPLIYYYLCCILPFVLFCYTPDEELFGLQTAPKYSLRRERRHEAIHPLSVHHLHRTDGDMALQGFFRGLENCRRKQSRARSETNSIEEPSEVEPALPSHTESVTFTRCTIFMNRHGTERDCPAIREGGANGSRSG